ncbi:MAG: DNA topoisomerase, partial [Verrucomicrobiales bacterium]
MQTPTLALMVAREKLIRAFESRPYWEVYGDFDVKAGQYRGRWFNPDHKKDPDDAHMRAERIWTEADAKSIEARCNG